MMKGLKSAAARGTVSAPRRPFMRHISLTLLVLAVAAGTARAQLELPRPSPLAKTSLMVGLTEVAIEYSSPGVKGRKIWGALVPFDEVWRTGANAPTKLSFSRDVTVAGQPVPAGSYALYTIPSKTSWTIILNKNVVGSGLAYKKEADLVRFQVTPKPSPPRERMAFLFSDYTDSSVSLDLEWEKLRVSIPIKANTDEQALANIKAMSDGTWRPYTSAARYMLETKKDYDAGLQLVEKSLSLKEEWLNVWTKAQLLAAKGHYKDAYPLAVKADELGKKSEQFFLEKEVKKALVEWKGK
jgi:hypothetical protein